MGPSVSGARLASGTDGAFPAKPQAAAFNGMLPVCAADRNSGGPKGH